MCICLLMTIQGHIFLFLETKLSNDVKATKKCISDFTKLGKVKTLRSDYGNEFTSQKI